MGSVSGFFSIDPISGVVVLEKSLDRESRDSYRIRVQATDQAGQLGALSSQVCQSSNASLRPFYSLLCSHCAWRSHNYSCQVTETHPRVYNVCPICINVDYVDREPSPW